MRFISLSSSIVRRSCDAALTKDSQLSTQSDGIASNIYRLNSSMSCEPDSCSSPGGSVRRCVMRARILPALLALVLLAACATNSSFVNTWNLRGAQPIHSATGKMAVVFMSPNGERRRAVEDQMVRQLGEHG